MTRRNATRWGGLLPVLLVVSLLAVGVLLNVSQHETVHA